MNVSVRAFMLLLRIHLNEIGTPHSQECESYPGDEFGSLVLQDPVEKTWLRVTAEPISEAWAKAEMHRKGDK